MADVFTKQKRSEVMSRIRGNGNKDTELALIRIFHQYHITGWRRNQRILGKPDFVFLRQKMAVFVDGCFWHKCPLHSNLPRNNRAFWENKLEGNVRRDIVVSRQLRKEGWRVVRIWEHELKDSDKVLKKLTMALASRQEG